MTDLTSDELADRVAEHPVLHGETAFRGAIWAVQRDTVDLGEGGVVQREYVKHPGAVCIVALDEQDNVLMLRQYRHPVQMELWELPAGLLDIPGEPALEAAKRELAEEADLRADRWDVLIDWFNSPGGMSEALRCYVARGLSPVPEAERHVRTGEERAMVARWVPLEQARDAVLAGRLHNPGAVVGLLAAAQCRAAGWTTLRPADAPWPEHPDQRDLAGPTT